MNLLAFIPLLNPPLDFVKMNVFFRSANQKLQDTNDGLVHMVDVNVLRSPRLTRKLGEADSDSDSMRSKSSKYSDRLRVTETEFKINRLLDDLDSGTGSTLNDEKEAIQTLDRVIQDHEPISIEQRDCDLTEVQRPVRYLGYFWTNFSTVFFPIFFDRFRI